MKYELILTSQYDSAVVNATFESDFVINKGDCVLGKDITRRNVILDVNGGVEKVELISFEYYRYDNHVFVKKEK